MEVKKKRKADVYRSRGMLLNLGLCIAIGLVISAFQWKSYEETIVPLSFYGDEFPEPIELPPNTVINPPPKPPKVIKIVEAPDPEVVKPIEIDIDQGDPDPINIDDFVPEPDDDDDECEFCVEDIAETMPSPVGGYQAFYKYVSMNIKFPRKAQRIGGGGKVFVQFVISKTGDITDVQVLKGIGLGCDEEAIRVVSQAPKWNPGLQRGRPVNVRMVIPIHFTVK